MTTAEQRWRFSPRLAWLAAGITLLVCSWVGATAPFQGPDEASHFVRTVGISRGVILGPRALYGPVPGETPTQWEFIKHDTRAYRLPTALIPPGQKCVKGTQTRSGCAIASPNGNFPPLGYLLPAAGVRAATNSSNGLWLARFAGALQSVAFLLLALVLLWEVSGWSMLGVLAAVSPMVLFTASVLNPSGIQTASSLAFVAALLRLARRPQPERAPGWIWWAAGVSGAVAILTGPIGLAFGLIDVILFFALLGPRRLRALAREHRPRILATGLLAAAIVSLAYSRIAGFDTRFGIRPIRASLRGGLDQLGPVVKTAVGNFASLTIPLPKPVVAIWLGLVLALVIAALWRGGRRERLTLVAVIVLVGAFPVLFWAWVDRLTGYGLQGREILPVLMLPPLVAGEIQYLRAGNQSPGGALRFAFWVFVTVVALVQGYAWWLAARAAAGTSGTPSSFSNAVWSPPLAWWPWIVAAMLGTLALLTFGVTESVRSAKWSEMPASDALVPASTAPLSRQPPPTGTRH